MADKPIEGAANEAEVLAQLKELGMVPDEFAVDSKTEPEGSTVEKPSPEDKPTEEPEKDEPPVEEPVKQEPSGEESADKEPVVEPEEDDEFGYNKDDKEPVAEPEQSEEDFDAETEKQVEGLDPKAQDGWKKLRAQVKELKAKASSTTELEERLAAAEEKAAQVDEMRASMDKVFEENYEVKVRTDKQYQEQYEQPVKEVGAALQKIADDFSLPAKDVVGLLSIDNTIELNNALKVLLPDTALDEDGVEVDLPDNAEYRRDVKSVVRDQARVYSRALDAQEKLLTSAKETYEAQDAKRAEEANTAQETALKQRKSHMAEWTGKYEARFGTEFAEALTKELAPVASVPWEQMTLADQTQALTGGAAAPVLMKQIKSLETELASLKGTDAANKGASPTVVGGLPSEEAKDASEDEMTADKYHEQWLAQNA